VAGNDFAIVGQTASLPASVGQNQISVTLSSAEIGDYWFVVVADDADRFNKGHLYKQAPERGLRVTLPTPTVDRGLPGLNVNGSAGANRCNIKWAGFESNTGYGDTFTLPDGQWIIDTIRVWSIPTVPGYVSYALGDHFSRITLYTSGQANSLVSLKSAYLAVGSNVTSSPDVLVTRTTYGNGEGYERADGSFDIVWRIDFKNLAWSVTGGQPYLFGVWGQPRIDRLWFNAAGNAILSGWSTTDSDGVRQFNVTQGAWSATNSDGIGWFGGKPSDIMVQVFAHQR
jgi:hypothetical protein